MNAVPANGISAIVSHPSGPKPRKRLVSVAMATSFSQRRCRSVAFGMSFSQRRFAVEALQHEAHE